jgi:hypothetical protein
MTYPLKLFSGSPDLSSLRTKFQLCDITFEIGDRLFPVNRMMLILSSSYFRTMFLKEFKEKHMVTIPLTDINPDHFDLIIDLFYGKRINLSLDTVISMTKLLQLYDVDLTCVIELLNLIEVNNKLIENPHLYLDLIQLIFGEIDQKYIDQIASEVNSEVDLKPLWFVSPELFFRLIDSPKWTLSPSHFINTLSQLITQLSSQKDVIGLIKLTLLMKIVEEKERLKGEQLKQTISMLEATIEMRSSSRSPL